ncbi:hypothetical protein Q5752_000942 [Cryptotrichosporon argae]
MMQVQSSSLIGVAIACSGNVLISLALTIQKLAHQRIHAPSPAHTPDSSSPSSDPPTPAPSRRPSAAIVLPPASSDTASGSPDSASDFEVVPILVVPSAAKDAYDRHVTLQPPTPDPAHDGGYEPDRDDNESETEGNGDGDDDGEHISGERTGPSETAYLRSKLWWLGLVMIAIGEGGNFLSYGFAPASVVAPLGTVALIANCVFAPLILKESINRRTIVGVALAITGAVTVVWSSNDTNPRLSPDQLTAALLATPFLVYTAIVAVVLAVLAYLSSLERYGARLILIDLGVCALFGGYTVMSTKALSSLLSTLFFAALRWPVTWLALAVLGTTSVAQVWYLNRALMRFESKQVIPTQFVLFSVSAIIGSAVLYQEFRGLNFSRFVNFVFGIATTFFGVYFLTSSPSSSPNSASSSPDSPSTRLATLARIAEDTPLLLPRPATASTAVSPRRVFRRASSSQLLTPGLSSQAGLLLLATTPPGVGGYGTNGRTGAGAGGSGGGGGGGGAAIGRTRSASRASRVSRESDDGRRGRRDSVNR